jgi:hypothetical protein
MTNDQPPITLAYIKELRISGRGNEAAILMTRYFQTSRKQKEIKRRELIREDARAHAALKRSQGLCIIFGCVRPHATGLACCAYHLAKKRAYREQQAEKKKAPT